MIGFQSAYRAAKAEGVNPWNGKSKNSIAIGEGMKRVGPAARDLGADALEFPEGMKPYFDKNLKLPANPDALDYNANWLQGKLDMNARVFDLGSKGNFIQSPFYNLEAGRTLGYPYLIPANYNSYLGGKLRIIRY